MEKDNDCFGDYRYKNCCQCCNVAVECYEKTNKNKLNKREVKK